MLRRHVVPMICCAVLLSRLAAGDRATAQDPQPKPPAAPAAATAPAAAPAEEPATDAATGLKRLAKDYDIWVDLKRKLVVIDGRVALREGPLEMFACPKGSKEHESIVAVNCKSQFVHAALLAVGAKAGHPMQYEPEYKPATGTVIDVHVLWKDEQGKNQKAKGQDWIKELKSGKAMTHPWVFAGSRFWTDPDTKQQLYAADGGDLICISNFTTATLDLPISSSQANADLLFGAFTDRIPPLGTKVRLVLIPRLETKDSAVKPDGKS